MASDRGERPRDEQGRFLPKEEAAKKTRKRAKKSGSQAQTRASSQKSGKPARKQASKPTTRKAGGASKAAAGKASGAAKAKAKSSGAKATAAAKPKASGTKGKSSGAAKPTAKKATKTKPAGEGARQAPPAPSIGPNTQIDRPPPSERLAEHEQSEVDAMGRDKRRSVVGGSYGPSVGKQATVYGAALAVIVVLVGGFFLLARELDQPPAEYATEAPWAEAAEQPPPQPLDFPRNGRTEVD